MLYNQNDKKSFDKLREAFKKAGFTQKNCELCIEYMTKEERDDSLLDGAAPQSFDYSAAGWSLKSDIAYGVKSVMKYGDEPTGRLFIFLSKMLGLTFSRFVQIGLAFSSGFNIDKAIDYTARLFSGYMGEEKALAYAYAAFMSLAAHDDREDIPDMKTLQVCAAAVDLCEEEDFITKLILCSYIFNHSEAGAENEYTGKAAQIVKAFTAKEKDSDKNTKIAALIAMAEGAYFSQEFEKMFAARAGGTANQLAPELFTYDTDPKRVLDMIHKVPNSMNVDYVHYIAYISDPKRSYKNFRALTKDPKLLEKYLIRIAKENKKLYIDTINKETHFEVSCDLDQLYKKNFPNDTEGLPDVRELMQQEIALDLEELLSTDHKGEIFKYLMGVSSGSLDKAMAAAKNTNRQMRWKKMIYPEKFGIDDFVKRCFTFGALNVKLLSSSSYLRCYTGFDFDNKVKEAVKILCEATDDAHNIIESLGELCDDGSYGINTRYENCGKALEEYANRFAELDIKSLSTPEKLVLALTFGKQPNKFKKQLLKLTDETSKTMKSILVSSISPSSGWTEEIKELLKAKKASKREIALDIIAEQGAEKYAEELNAAFESEKSEKIRDKIALLLGQQVQSKDDDQPKSMEKIIDDLTKGSKSKKVDWLFKDEIAPVKDTNGNAIDEKILKALVASYACMDKCGVNPIANEIAKDFDKAELEGFVKVVFGKWLDLGAQAKTKWVLYFTAIHGGNGIVNDLLHYIKEWGENARGAIASEAVKALALNGSPIAFINVDNISRKFKNKQVRGAAAEALREAAEQLGITTEELQDRIVPDLGFNEDRYREFDYGSRQFRVYISPALELEILNGDKKVKSMPKPGANDDAEKANPAYEDFKELKKQLKTVVTNQKQRLEYVMLCDRKWSAEGWERLFVKNPIMHSFAIGLIWGTYEDGKLTQSFRFMEDGSFTTSDEEEFTLPENAQIGLVHPIELSKEECETWQEQLSDYEIVQPFKQLSRQVFTLNEDEKGKDCIERFHGCTMNSLSLINKMLKLGWYKGEAEDAGWFYYFVRNDITSRTKNEDGSFHAEGKSAMLVMSGASIVNYDFEGEEVTIEELIFFDPNKMPWHWDKERKYHILTDDVDKRYFSEIIMQLNTLFGDQLSAEE